MRNCMNVTIDQHYQILHFFSFFFIRIKKFLGNAQSVLPRKWGVNTIRTSYVSTKEVCCEGERKRERE